MEDSRESLITAAAEAMQQQRYDAAQAAYGKLCTLSPFDIDAKFLYGAAASRAGKVDQAIRAFQEALKIAPDHLETLSALSHVLRVQGRPDEAIPLAEKAVALEPHNPLLKHNLGRCYLAVGDIARAEIQFDEAATLNPENPALLRDIAKVHQLQDRSADAATALQQSINIAPDDPEGYALLAQLCLGMGDGANAVPLLKRAYELDPYSPKGLYRLALALNEEGKFAEAEAAARRALEKAPKMADAMTMLGRVLQIQGKFAEAEPFLRSAISANPNQVAPYYMLTVGKRMTPDDRDFVAQMERQAARKDISDPDRAHFEYALGKAYDDLGQYDKAISHFDEANRIELERATKVGHVYNPDTDRALLNHVVETYTKERFETLEKVGSKSETPVFIVGMERSGTSLLEQILSSHPSVGAAGELLFWAQRAEEAERAVLMAGDEGQSALKGIADAYLKELEELGGDSARITDKRPDNFALLGPIHCAFPNARIVCCLRDPIDNCLSIYFTAFSFGPSFLHDRANIVSRYQRHLDLLEHWQAVLPENCFKIVRYEDLVKDREETIRGVVDFLGLPWDDACLKHEENPRPISTPSVWQARQPVYDRSVSRSKHYEPWLREFEALKK